jgi:hypothetical protein
MIGLAISVLWLCIGIIVLGGVIWIALTVVRKFFPGGINANVEYAVWAIFAILILIYLLGAIAGGGSFR